jgi:hypothetical protein
MHSVEEIAAQSDAWHEQQGRIAPCAQVDIISFWGGERRSAKSFIAIPYETSRGSDAAYFPQANVLVLIGS